MNRLRIVIEEAGGLYEVKYVGHDAGAAQEALHEPTANRRALYVYPHPTQYNRPILEGQTIPVSGEETPSEDVPIGQAEGPSAVDEAAELVGGATEAPSEPVKKAKPSKKAK